MTGYKKAFSEEERINLADVVQYLNCEVRPLFDADEWKQLRHYLHLGIRDFFQQKNPAAYQAMNAISWPLGEMAA